nr:hypothetical protein [Sphingomonas sp. CDS-1]
MPPDHGEAAIPAVSRDPRDHHQKDADQPMHGFGAQADRSPGSEPDAREATGEQVDEGGPVRGDLDEGNGAHMA